MHVLTRVTSFSHACQLSPIEENHDSSPSFRRVNLHLGLATNSIEEASWWSSESPTTSTKFTFETFDTWKLLASEAKVLFQEQQEILYQDEGYGELDMTASWSSAATGKPQLSYAERLRRAKEGSTIAEASSLISSPMESVMSTTTSQTSTSNDVKEQVSSQPEASTSATKISTNGSAAVANDIDNPSTLIQNVPPPTSSDVLSTQSKLENTTINKTAPITNVWEARRQKLLEQQQKKASTNDATSSATAASNGINIDHQSSSAPMVTNDLGGNAAQDKINAWAKKPVLVKDTEQNSQTKKDSAPVINGTNRGTFQDPASQTQIKGSKANKGEQKRQMNTAINVEREAKIKPPSLGDEQVWPSPDVAVSAKASVDDSKDRVSRPLTTANSTQTGLQGLDVELLNPSGAEKQRHGKQWIAIVPNITHTSPLPSTSGNTTGSKKKGHKSSNASTTVSSAQRSNKKTDQRKSNSSPMHPEKESKERLDRSALTSPQMSEASLMGSPRFQSYTTSPVLARFNMDHQAQEEGQNINNLSAFAHNDLLHGNTILSTPPLRSPSSTSRGSVRGPRFSDERKTSPNGSIVWRGPLVNGHDSLPSPTISSPVLSKGTIAEDTAASMSNALHISKPQSSLSSPLLSQRQATSVGTGSISGASGAPTPGFIASTDSIWYADGRLPQQRSRSIAPSPRGHRGRGGSRKKASDEEDALGDSGSSVKNDIEGRGLPEDVPSGPRHSNQVGQKAEGSKGQGNHRGRHYNRDGMQHGMLSPQSSLPPLPYGATPSMFYPQYYPVPPSFPSTLLPAPLEKTPVEFAPTIESSSTEPSRKLLNQLEFYFSHRNLEGDFYLRKSMDSQGFVPIDLIANFKKVKQLIDNMDVVKDTLAFSQVLEMDSDRSKVRKAINWHLYTLLEGERPKANALYQQPVTGGGGGGGAPIHYPNQYTAYPNPNLPFPPHHMINNQSAPLHYSQGQPPYTYAPMHLPYPQAMPFIPQDQSGHLHQGNGPMKQIGVEGDIDNEDDEVLGVVAAEGLGGALRM